MTSKSRSERFFGVSATLQKDGRSADTTFCPRSKRDQWYEPKKLSCPTGWSHGVPVAQGFEKVGSIFADIDHTHTFWVTDTLAAEYASLILAANYKCALLAAFGAGRSLPELDQYRRGGTPIPRYNSAGVSRGRVFAHALDLRAWALASDNLNGSVV